MFFTNQKILGSNAIRGQCSFPCGLTVLLDPCAVACVQHHNNNGDDRARKYELGKHGAVNGSAAEVSKPRQPEAAEG